jgi:MATE family multidrug resistance protein
MLMNNDFFSVAKRLYKLALPMASIQLITIASSFICMVMLSKLGHQVLAASALIFSTQISLIVIGSSLLFSLSILVGHAYGAKDFLGIGHFVQQGWTLGLILSLPVMFIGWHIKSLLVFAGQAPDIANIVQAFFHRYVFAIPAVMLFITNQQLCYGIQKQYIVTRNNMLLVTVLLTSAYVLIFGHLGFPALGVKGYAIAMVLQSWFSLFFMMGWFYVDSDFKAFHLFRYRVHLDWSYLRKMFEIGWPISVQITAELLSFFVFSVMMGWIGTTALAAYQIVTQYLMLIVIPSFALAQSTGVIIGQANGAEEYQVISKLGYASMAMAFGMSLISGLIFLLMPKILASFYLHPTQLHYAETLRLTVVLFAISAVSQLFDGLRNVITGALRGLFDTRFPMWISISVIWLIGIPLGYCMSFKWHWGMQGIAIGMMCGFFVGMLAAFYRWQKLCARYLQVTTHHN